MRLLISLAVSFGMLVAGLALLVVLRAKGYDPVSAIAGFFLPRQANTPGGAQ